MSTDIRKEPESSLFEFLFSARYPMSYFEFYNCFVFHSTLIIIMYVRIIILLEYFLLLFMCELKSTQFAKISQNSTFSGVITNYYFAIKEFFLPFD